MPGRRQPKGAGAKRRKPDAQPSDRPAEGPRRRYLLRLYVAGTTPRSARSVANLHSVCEERLSGKYDLEVIDIYQQPHQAILEQVVAVPMLVKKLPEPERRIVGDLSERERVLVALDLHDWDADRIEPWAAV